MKIKVCMGKACKERFAEYILKRLKSDIEFYNKSNIEIEESMCMGKCDKGPNIKIGDEIHNYMNPAKASELIFKPKKKVSNKKKKKNANK